MHEIKDSHSLSDEVIASPFPRSAAQTRVQLSVHSAEIVDKCRSIKVPPSSAAHTVPAHLFHIFRCSKRSNHAIVNLRTLNFKCVVAIQKRSFGPIAHCYNNLHCPPEKLPRIRDPSRCFLGLCTAPPRGADPAFFSPETKECTGSRSSTTTCGDALQYVST